ncbi:hypothetical protein DRW71_20735 [Salmonella enterica subsp. diarizonae]|uniref:Uncharacterized protein n=2 Tax=Salmonella enterica TaxID=28901 RepID=A0A3V7Z1E6_SALER|nr:hypothetical protein LFZ53_04090 [Salmonella enterica subsp. diarizonae serovar 50:k:z str. MZ0080]ATW56228.1 hypothetical protein CNQ75_17925 [Salmonella enterica subsp. diarizonae]AXD08267.1 hypothetical protein CHE29_04345 [Salmonella enterica]EBV2372908.1 hypothetical protein [Salmonella enterica subsp. enterica serovar Enteritidis]EBY1048668.1 hypothetical protein [Salmonella enterica subsp. enterica serovar Bareilly]ECU8749807.1 hypothetical protein [Salmonella enterica subsp. diarizo
MILTVRYLAYLPSAGINIQNKHRISNETSEDISKITFVVIEVKRERFVYMLQTVSNISKIARVVNLLMVFYLLRMK